MATSRAIKKPKRDDTQLSNWQPMPERAPSVEVSDRPTVARIVAMIGLFLTVLGTLESVVPDYHPSAHAWACARSEYLYARGEARAKAKIA